MTLVELLVVLTVLVALGGIVATTMNRDVLIRTGDGTERSADQIVTLATMQAVRDALLGTSPTDPGYWQDLSRLPRSLGALIVRPLDDPPYDPATKHGWNGPYLIGSGSRYEDRIASGDGFPNNSDIPGIEDEPAILDAWGKPIVLQIPEINDTLLPDYARIVSAGPNRELDTDPNDLGAADRGDDLVIFLRINDPNL